MQMFVDFCCCCCSHFNLFIFSWKIIALPYCVGFRHTSTWISHRYTYVPSLLNLPPTSHPCHPSRLSQSPGLTSLSHRANSTGYFTYGIICFRATRCCCFEELSTKCKPRFGKVRVETVWQRLPGTARASGTVVALLAAESYPPS